MAWREWVYDFDAIRQGDQLLPADRRRAAVLVIAVAGALLALLLWRG